MSSNRPKGFQIPPNCSEPNSGLLDRSLQIPPSGLEDPVETLLCSLRVPIMEQKARKNHPLFKENARRNIGSRHYKQSPYPANPSSQKFAPVYLFVISNAQDGTFGPRDLCRLRITRRIVDFCYEDTQNSTHI